MPEQTQRRLCVFLNHAPEDKPQVRELSQRLKRDGIQVWLDEDCLLPGQVREDEIMEALRNVDAVITCLSTRSVSEEGVVQKEIKTALDIHAEKPEGTIFLIPVKLDACTVPRRLAGLHHVDFYSDAGYEKLLSSLHVRAQDLGIQITAPPQDTLPDRDLELTLLVKNITRDEEGLQEGLSYLSQREPGKDGWFHEAIRKELLHRMSASDRTAKERARAGDVLSQVGDPRFLPDAWYLPADDQLGFVEIPAGTFLMGNDAPADADEEKRESPLHPVDLPPYFISRYPVTVAQFTLFLKETQPAEKLPRPGWGLDNHPVVSITWFEAIEYCTWLTDKLRSWKDTPAVIAQPLRNSSWAVTLPSEAEWEKAVRGMADTRKYPWGPIFDPERANCKSTTLDATSAVGCFERGNSPFHLYEMSGNVSEWTRSNWGYGFREPSFGYPYIVQNGREEMHSPSTMLKVIRGGSFYSSKEDIRCSYRSAALPNKPYSHLGFRPVITLLKKPSMDIRR